MLATPSSPQSNLRETQNVVRGTESIDGVAPNRAARSRSYFTAAASVGFLLLIALGLFSCGAPRPIRFYQLNPPALAAAPAQTYPVTIVLGAIFASPIYSQDRIVYGTESEGMGLYLYERWAEPPTLMVQELLLRELRGSKRFNEVYTVRTAVHGDYLLRGRLYDFKEVSGGSVVARVSFELELRENKTGLTVWNFLYHQDEPVAGTDAAAVVAALDKNVARGASEVGAGLAQYFADHPPQPATPVAQN